LIEWDGQFTIETAGQLSALRFVTKNILAIVMENNSTIDWLNHYMALPLATPINVAAGDVVQVSFQYRAGGSIESLQNSMRVNVKSSAKLRSKHLSLAIG